MFVHLLPITCLFSSLVAPLTFTLVTIDGGVLKHDLYHGKTGLSSVNSLMLDLSSVKTLKRKSVDSPGLKVVGTITNLPPA